MAKRIREEKRRKSRNGYWNGVKEEERRKMKDEGEKRRREEMKRDNESLYCIEKRTASLEEKRALYPGSLRSLNVEKQLNEGYIGNYNFTSFSREVSQLTVFVREKR